MPLRVTVFQADRRVLAVGAAARPDGHRTPRRVLQPGAPARDDPAPHPRIRRRLMDERSVFLDELTEPEVAELIASGTQLLLIPTGSTEQHGPHGPIGTDVIIPREVCRRAATARGGLVAPP